LGSPVQSLEACSHKGCDDEPVMRVNLLIYYHKNLSRLDMPQSEKLAGISSNDPLGEFDGAKDLVSHPGQFGMLFRYMRPPFIRESYPNVIA